MGVVSALLRVAEFVRLPGGPGGIRQELHHGELVESPAAKKLHTRVQKRLVSPLEAALDQAELGVDKEFPFRPAAEYEVWVADVAVFSRRFGKRRQMTTISVVCRILSSKSCRRPASELLEREEICLGHGGKEFWLVDPQREIVKAVRAGGHSGVYDIGGRIDSTVLGGSVVVRDIFVS